MSFLRNLFFGNESQRNQEIDAHIQTVNIRLDIQNEAEHNFQIAYEKLTEKQKKIVDKSRIEGFVFPTRGDYLDFKRYKCEEFLEKQGISKEDLRKEYVGFLNSDEVRT